MFEEAVAQSSKLWINDPEPARGLAMLNQAFTMPRQGANKVRSNSNAPANEKFSPHSGRIMTRKDGFLTPKKGNHTIINNRT